jgi:hypothetical protein
LSASSEPYHVASAFTCTLGMSPLQYLLGSYIGD